MTIHVPPEDIERLKRLVASGRFDTIEDALTAAIAVLEASESIDDAWAKPFIDEAAAALDRGEGTTWTKGETLERLHAGHPELASGKNR